MFLRGLFLWKGPFSRASSARRSFCRKQKRKLYIFHIDFFISIVYDNIASCGTALCKNKEIPCKKLNTFILK